MVSGALVSSLAEQCLQFRVARLGSTARLDFGCSAGSGSFSFGPGSFSFGPGSFGVGVRRIKLGLRRFGHLTLLLDPPILLPGFQAAQSQVLTLDSQ